jgi:hypothetical protein
MPTESSTAPEYLCLVEESAYGTPVTPLVPGTNQLYIRLTESNSFSVIAESVQQEIPFGGGFDVPADVVADNYTVVGSLKTLLYPSQAAFLLGWSLTRVNVGGTVPWTTSEPPYDLASVSAYHAIRRRDGTWKYTYYPGGKVTSGKLSVSRGDPKAKLELGLQFQKEIGNVIDASSDLTTTTFPISPADTVYPIGPYLHGHTAANVLFGGTALVQYESLELSWTNKLDPRWFESHWLSILGCHGREFSADIALLLKATPNMRDIYMGLADKAVDVTFTNGTHSAVINMNGKNHLKKAPYDLQLGKEFMQPITIRNRWDGSVPGDITVTTT